MLEEWGIELAKGVGRLFLNPLLYWFIILVFVVGYKRIRRSRRTFGTKIFGVGDELSYTLGTSLLAGTFISIVFIGGGVVFSYQTLFLLSIVFILLSCTFRLTLLSPSYSVGIAYLLLLFLPLVIERQSFFKQSLFAETNFVGLSLLVGLFLIVEGFLLKQTKNAHTYPDLYLTRRGKWIGRHHLSKLAVIPFFTLIPTGTLEPFADYWPYVAINGETYGLILFPFVIGFDHIAKGTLPQKAAERLSRSTILHGLIVLFFAVGSIYVGWLATIAIGVAILGKELINYRYRITESQKRPYFPERDQGLAVLEIIPESPAARLDIMAGDTIKKVNGKQVDSIQTFYEALQYSGAFFKLELIDTRGEIRFVQSAFYEGEHHELGIVFVKPPFRH